jgi:HlyD family secretion protein
MERLKRLPRRWWLVAAALVAIVMLVLVLRPDAIAVEAARAEVGPMREVLREDGRTRVRDRYVVVAPVTGSLDRLAVREGAKVTRGDILAQLAPPPLDARARAQAEEGVAAAQARSREAATRVAQAQASLETAWHALSRRRVLAEQGAIAPEVLEQFALDAALREEELLAAHAAADAARAQEAAARAALLGAGAGGGATVPVRAPATGRVLRLPDASGRVVAAGTTLLEIGDVEAIDVVIPVLSEDAVRILPGARVEIEGWGGEHPLDGRVRQVEPSGYTRVSALGIEEQRVNVIVDLGQRPSRLGDGYRVEAAITLWQTAAALQIPSSALVQRGETWTVYAIERGRAVLREVQIGHRDGASAEITGGLEEGEQVILFPSDRIDDGVRVKPRDPA